MVLEATGDRMVRTITMMSPSSALQATLLIIMLSYVAAKKESNGKLVIAPEECIGGICILDEAYVSEVKPGPKAQQAVISKTIIVPPVTNKKDKDDGFKPLSKSENKRVQSICGTAEESFARIKNGYTAKPKQFPWIVDLGFCTGSLISSRHVLSAAHCFIKGPKEHPIDMFGDCGPRHSGKTLQNLTIGYGGNCRTKSTHCPSGTNMKRATIERVIYPYKNGSLCLLDHDIAVLTLKEDVEFNDYVRPICISKLHSDTLVQLKDVGVGYMDQWRHNTSIVRYMDSEIFHMLSDREVITKGIRNPYGLPDVCPGDSGGPLQGTFEGSNRTYLLGIHSHGSACNANEYNSLTSTYVPAFADWLCKLTGVCDLE